MDNSILAGLGLEISPASPSTVSKACAIAPTFHNCPESRESSLGLFRDDEGSVRDSLNSSTPSFEADAPQGDEGKACESAQRDENSVKGHECRHGVRTPGILAFCVKNLDS